MSTHQMSQYRRTQQYATVESLLPENNVQAVQVLQSQEKLARVEPSGSYTQKHSGGQAENRNTSLAWLLFFWKGGKKEMDKAHLSDLARWFN